MKAWNVYSIERREGRVITKFTGRIESEEQKLKRAARDVSKPAGVKLEIFEAAIDNWRRPDPA